MQGPAVVCSIDDDQVHACCQDDEDEEDECFHECGLVLVVVVVEKH